MLGIRHPFSRELYERDEDGNVIVHAGDKWGKFARNGQWIEGEVREGEGAQVLSLRKPLGKHEAIHSHASRGRLLLQPRGGGRPS